MTGPFFFENEQRASVTVNGERCRDRLNEFLFPKIEEDDIDDIWFQQVGGHLPHSQRNNRSFAHRLGKLNNQPKFWSFGRLGAVI